MARKIKGIIPKSKKAKRARTVRQGLINVTNSLFNKRKAKRICLAFGHHFCIVVGFDFEIRLAGARLRRPGLSDYFAIRGSHLL